MILVVDDMQQNLYMMRALLEGHGYAVEFAHDGAEALEKARRLPPDLIISDILMPVMDGFMLCREWKQDPVLKDVPFVFYTATYVTSNDERFAMELGADDFIIKPAEPAEFLEKVKKVLLSKKNKTIVKKTTDSLTEGTMLKEYNELLVHKLEQKLQELQEARLKVEREQARLYMALDTGGVGMWDWDIASGKIIWDEVHLRIWGLKADQFDGTYECFRQTVHPADLPALDEKMERALADRGVFAHEFRIRWPDASEHWIDTRGRFQYNDLGEAIRGFGVATDVSDKKLAEQKIQYLAYFDALTGMPNRNLFQDRVTQAISASKRENKELALLLLDLDFFKIVNDSLGHSAGDQLLQIVAKRLLMLVRYTDTVARFGGDEFVMLLTESGVEGSTRIARQILDAFSEPFDLEGHKINVGSSIGISVCPQDAEDYTSLLRNADTALYRAKEIGRNTFQFFTAEMNSAALDRLNLEGALHQAVDKKEFTLNYQPQIDLLTGKVVGIEALLRWHDPKSGWVPPNKFIPIAESIGLINAIGTWTLHEACSQNKKWQDDGLLNVPISVNLSAIQIHQSNLFDVVTETLTETGMDPKYLELEVTESLLVGNADSVQAQFSKLKNVGVCFSIDDFGTGYSNLSYLKRFPVDKLKIDQAFIRGIHEDPDDLAIAKAVISVGHNLHLRVVAEGVERESQLECLKELECDEVQGYLFAKPMCPENFQEWMNNYKKKFAAD